MKTTLIISLFVMLIAFAPNKSLAQSNDVEGEIVSPEQPLKAETNTAPIVRAGDIYASCQHHFENTFNTSENIAKRASCNGYFFGTGGILLLLQNENLKTGTCVPEDISAHDLTKVFLDWAQDPKSDLNISAPEATLKAIRAAYKCN